MKHGLVTLMALAFSTAASAQLPTVPWRSPFTPAPALAGFSRLDAERHQKVMEQELAAWKARRAAVALKDR